MADRIRSGDVFSNQEKRLQKNMDHYEFDDEYDLDEDMDIPGPGENEAQGVFAEEDSVFDDELEPHSHALVTRAEEIQPSLLPGQKAPTTRKLVSTWTADGHMVVAQAVDGQRVEQWRPPTPEEFELFKRQGRLVKGAVGASSEPSKGGGWKKILFSFAAIAALGGGGWYLYNRYKKDEDDLEDKAEEI